MTIRQYTDPRFGECVGLQSEEYELAIPLSYGLRVMHFAQRGGANLFFEQPSEMTEHTLANGWQLRGGHRLWTAPEDVHCYEPDNAPIRFVVNGDEVWFRQRLQYALPVRKALGIRFVGDAVEVRHTVCNCSDEPLRIAVWPITALRPGGQQTIPIPRRQSEYLPDRFLSLWNGAGLDDPRLVFNKDEIRLHHTPVPEPFKLGVFVAAGTVRYRLPDTTFCLEFDADLQAEYPDGRVNYETYLCEHMVEMESLSPLVMLRLGEELCHRERWWLEAST